MKPIRAKSLVPLQHHLKWLRLRTMHDECERLATCCAQGNVDHSAFLLQLCELELVDRERRSSQRRLQVARFPNRKTLDNFKFESQPSRNRLLVAELMRCQCIEQRESVILTSNPGTGKTHLATARPWRLDRCASHHCSLAVAPLFIKTLDPFNRFVHPVGEPKQVLRLERNNGRCVFPKLRVIAPGKRRAEWSMRSNASSSANCDNWLQQRRRRQRESARERTNSILQQPFAIHQPA